MIQGKDREDTIRKTAAALGISEVDAEEIYAIEHGESVGDVVMIDRDGREKAPPSDVVGEQSPPRR